MPQSLLTLNSCYDPSRRNNPFVTVLGWDVKLKVDIFPYLINQCQPATEQHYATSSTLPNAKASQAKQAKQANLHCTLQPQHNVGDKVLVSSVNINIEPESRKMKPH